MKHERGKDLGGKKISMQSLECISHKAKRFRNPIRHIKVHFILRY